MEYTYKCKKCGRKFTYKVANHSVEIVVDGKNILKACSGKIVKIEVDRNNNDEVV
jgi:transposase-like protein